MSKAGVWYTDASGKPIYNKGKLAVAAKDEKFNSRNVTFQAAKVIKPLFAGAQAAMAGFRTVLENDSKGRNRILEDGVYGFDLWVKDPSFHGQGKNP